MAESLPTAILGRTGMEVTRLGYGSGFRKAVTREQADSVLNTALDLGINYIDTANCYKNSEDYIGKAIMSRRREFLLATKCGCSPAGHIWTPDNLFHGIEESLRRLGVEYVDLIQLHNPTVEDCEKGDLVAALEKMKTQGKVRWIGVSSTLPDLPVFLDWGVFDVFQIPYSALERDHEDWISRVATAGAGVVNRGGVALGEPGKGLGKPERWDFFEKAGLDEFREEGESPTAFMLRFTLTHPHIHTSIVGTTSVEHLQENVKAVERGVLSSDVYEHAKQRIEGVGVKPSTVGES